MKPSSLFSCLALALALTCSSCGGGGGGGSSSAEDSVTALGAGSLSGAMIVSSMNDWPAGSSVNQVVIVSLELGEGTSYSDGVETGTVVNFVCLALSAETGLADMQTSLPSGYSYSKSSGELTLKGLDVFGSGSTVDVVLQLSSASDTSMDVTMKSISPATDSSGVSYKIILLDDSMTLRLPGYVDDGSDDSDSSYDDDIAPMMLL